MPSTATFSAQAMLESRRHLLGVLPDSQPCSLDLRSPTHADGLARALGETHRRYTGYINARARQTGHLFQSRFGSVVMDGDHLLAAVRCVSLNPVRARLVRRARDWRWSSVRAHLSGADDALVAVRPLLDRVPHFADLVATASGEVAAAAFAALRAAETIGRPLGDDAFLAHIEATLGRVVRPGKRGRKPIAGEADAANKKRKSKA